MRGELSEDQAWQVRGDGNLRPPIMIRFTLPVFFELGFSKENIITSLEMRMKCGIGKCGRCNVGEKYVCKDGPVFSLAELDKLTKEY